MEEKINCSKGIYELMKEEVPIEDKGVYHLDKKPPYEYKLYVGRKSYEFLNKLLEDAWKKESEQDGSSL